MKYNSNDVEAMLYDFGDMAYIDGNEVVGVYLTDWITTLETSVERTYFHVPSVYFTEFYPAYGSTIEIPSESYSGRITEVTSDGAGYAVLALEEIQ